MAATKTYTTIQGDTWDKIAYKVYGDELRADFLMAHNYPLLDILVFSAGTEVKVPPLPKELQGDLPPWRTNEIEESEDPYDL